MIIRKVILVGYLYSITNFIQSQTIKTYKGTYFGGEGTYEYYENSNYERIFNGKLDFKKDVLMGVNSSGRGGKVISITGNFNENKKSGKWTAKETTVIIGRSDAGYTTIVSGNFRQGQKVGKWEYNVEAWAEKKVEKVNYSFNFNNNTLIGDIKVAKIEGKLDTSGNFTGSWNVKKDDIEYIAEFQNNIFTKLIVRNFSDGKIIFRNIVERSPGFFNDTISNSTEGKVGNVFYKVSDCNSYFNINDYEYYGEFYKFVSETLGSFDNVLDNIELGSTPITIKHPKVFYFIELTEKEKEEIRKQEEYRRQQKLEEERKEREIIEREKERLIELERKQKVNETIVSGENLYKNKKYKEALKIFKTIEERDITNELSHTIKETESEISRIENLYKSRIETYNYISRRTDSLNIESKNLKIALDDKKNIYGKNYDLCMSYLSTNFTNYSESLKKLMIENNTNPLVTGEEWNEKDQEIFDVQVKYKSEFLLYQNFHYSVKYALESENKDKLKLLKSSDDPKEIIKAFN
jgi:hypothetical protein